MDNTQNKAHQTPYGSSVISGISFGRPQGPTLPGTDQLCGPCRTGSGCPIHDGRGAGPFIVTKDGPEAEPTPIDQLSKLVTRFLDGVIEHVAERTVSKLREEVTKIVEQELSAREIAEHLAELPSMPYRDIRLEELRLALGEHGIDAFVAKVSGGDVTWLMVRWTESTYVQIISDDGITFKLMASEAAIKFSFEGMVDAFVAKQRP